MTEGREPNLQYTLFELFTNFIVQFPRIDSKTKDTDVTWGHGTGDTGHSKWTPTFSGQVSILNSKDLPASVPRIR